MSQAPPPPHPVVWVLMTSWGPWPIPVARLGALRSLACVVVTANRLLFLLSLMLLCTGLLMALDAPRTLGRLLVLMAAMELLVLAAAGGLVLMAHLHRRLRARFGASRRRPSRRVPILGPRLHWWTYEAALALLAAAWWIVPA